MNAVISPEIVLLLMITTMVIFIIMGYPVAFVLGGIATLFGLVFIGPGVFDFFMFRMYNLFSDYLLVAVPMFVFMGIIIEKSGIAVRLYDAMHIILGRLNGGLAVATVITCTIFAAATGVIGASVVTMSLLAVPAMLKYKYDKGLATGSVCAGGTLGVLIPPSVLIIIYGQAAGISVGQLFMGAVTPGILLSTLYVVYILIRSLLNPAIAPAISPEEVKAPLSKKIYLFSTSVLPVAALILTILGSIFFGIAAPTEAAGIGALAALGLSFAYGGLTIDKLKDAVYRTTRISAMAYMLLIGSGFFSLVFIRLGGTTVVRNALLGLPFGDIGILLVMLLIVVLMGMFLDPIAVVMIAVPILTPIAESLEFHPIWFALIVSVALQVGFLSPPFAMSIFYLKGSAPPEIATSDIYKGVVPFLCIQAIAIVLLIVFPEIITWLPELMF